MATIKTVRQQIEDALWYLERPGHFTHHKSRAIEILSSIARGSKRGKELVDAIRASPPEGFSDASVPWGSLKGVEIAVIPGHQPGGGAQGERIYNKKVARFMQSICESKGATIFYYEHKIRAYGARQDDMRTAVKAALPNCFMVHELHYDGYKPRPEAAGHHFKYRGAKKLAQFTQEEFLSHFPQSHARSWNAAPGLHHCTSGNGAGFLKKAPGWAILTEPFFITNPAERAFFKGREEELALIYCIGAARFANYKGK